jgi:uncharacterized membrane protein
MNLVVTLYVALLFFVLTPGVLLSLPKGGSKYTVALIHGVVFAFVFYLTHKLVWKLSMRMQENFQNMEMKH